jgi:low temperature requirement protein LtrA
MAAPRIIVPPAVGVVLGLLSTLVDGYPRFTLLALGLMFEIAPPLLLRNPFDGLPRVSISKTHERLGLFTIIVLGETVVGIVSGLTALDHPSAADFFRAGKALVIGCYFWWVYYESMPHGEFRQSPRGIVLWAYLHFPIFIAISGISPAIASALTSANDSLPFNFRLILAISLSTFLISVALIELLVYNTDDHSKSGLAGTFLKFLSAIGVFLAAFIPFSADALLLCIAVPLILPVVYRGYSRYRLSERDNKNPSKIA